MKKETLFLLAALSMPHAAVAADQPLTEEEVCDFIETRIASHHLQLYFIRNTDKFNDAPRAFFKERDMMLRDMGWTVEEYEARRDRVNEARSYMEQVDRLEKRKEKLPEREKEIRSMTFVSEEKREEMIEAERKSLDEQMARYTSNRKDWPAVRPQLERMEHLTDWVAMNVPNPPLGCDGEEVEVPPPPEALR